jgi:cbb3-type cytochrome c oxidase subunit III
MRIESRALGGLKIYLVLSFVAVLLGGSYIQHVVAGQRRSRSESPQARGRTLYMQNCARCHGADGHSQTEMGQLYDATDLTDARWWRDQHISNQRLTNSITNGKKGGMPAFGKKLSRTDINALVAFVRTFKK